jgi:hypothetical protein
VLIDVEKYIRDFWISPLPYIASRQQLFIIIIITNIKSQPTSAKPKFGANYGSMDCYEESAQF